MCLHGPRIRRSTDTADKKLAQQLHDKVKHDLWKQVNLGERPEHTLKEVVDRWKKRAAEKKLRAIDDIGFRLDWWLEKLGPDRPLADVLRKEIMAAIEGKMTIPKNKVEKPRLASPGNTTATSRRSAPCCAWPPASGRRSTRPSR